ncbi:CDC48 family AAA ATPase [Candidatus Woesearchaeota archaeon]|nr:CDC48 family AAA ATPase [Candidatus Woesearchaeota archaeon]
MTPQPTHHLIVTEALHHDAGKSIARISSDVMHKLKLNQNDVIEITGKSKTVATVWPARKEDETQESIRIDSLTRFNAETSLGSTVTISKIDSQPAQSITISPLENVQFSSDPTPYILQRLVGKVFLKKQRVAVDIMGTQLQYVVSKLSPAGCVRITQNTQLTISDTLAEEQNNLPTISYEDIGGLKREIDLIREMVELPMKHPEVFERLGVSAPKGVLLTGPPGTGKTLLAKAVASETESTFYSIAGPEIMSKFYGESEKHIRDIFEQANKNAPSIIFIDEIDSIAPKRGDGKDQTEKRIVAQLLTAMDGLKTRGNVVVMAATNRPDDIDEALRRPGRFDRELRIMPPNDEGRLEILEIHTRGMPLAKDVELTKIARKTIGFTGADLEVLCKEAALKALKPYIPSLKEFSVKVPTSILEKLEIKNTHFEEALQMVEPSAMREVMISKPNVKWSDIGGLEEIKQKLRETIELPLLKPDLFKKAGIKPPKGVLLSGPPGTGKTLLAKAVANEANANFISIKGPELISKWVGESEKQIRDTFQRARLVAPTVIFFDEFDSITKTRGASLNDSTERMVNQLLTEIDGIENLENVTIIAATNRPDLIDPALLRPGRIELKIDIPLPDTASREQIFRVHTKDMPLAKEIKLKEFVEKTQNWSGAEIESLCREAGLNAIRRVQQEENPKVVITKEDLTNALREISLREKKDKK